MNILPLAFSIGTISFDLQHGGMLPSFNPLASIIGHTLGSMNNMDNLPVPITTTEFPDIQKGHRRLGKRIRTSVQLVLCPPTIENCPICLEDMTDTIQIPCGHTFHRICIFSVLTTTTMGSDSMMRCPLCRYRLDRYDLLRVNFFERG